MVNMGSLESVMRTPLHDTHVKTGGRMVPFSGWEMPIQYSSILAEARAVRSTAGLFDVSHMGRLEISGNGAQALLDKTLSIKASNLKLGQARYNVICTERGGIIDDTIVYRYDKERFLLIPNAGNRKNVIEWLHSSAPDRGNVQIRDITLQFSMIAHQGPQSEMMLQKLTSDDLANLKPFHLINTSLAGVDSVVARTGYTGEDGFELIVPNERVVDVWHALENEGATPCGLGSRDVLRLEAGLALHGNDIDTSTNPYEAGLARFVDPDRDGYIARQSLTKIRDTGPNRKLTGFRMLGRGIPRPGYRILDGPKDIGKVSSGGVSVSTDMNIGLGYVPTLYSHPGSHFQIDIRGRNINAEVVKLPFYSRRRKK